MVVVIFLSYYFLRNKETMFTPSAVFKEVEDIGSDCIYDVQILIFLSGVEASSLKDEDQVILEACLLSERETMPISFGPPSLYFYLYSPSSRI